jgi:hypothetical protein
MMSGITDYVGEGWNERNILKNFNKRNNIVNGQEEVAMTTSNQFEQAYIILSTMTKIKLSTKKGKGNLFTIECYMPSFEPKKNQFASNMLQCSKVISTRSTLGKIWLFPCRINLLLI